MTIPPVSNRWPMLYEYEEALLKRKVAFQDSEIRNGKLEELSEGQPQPLNGGGSRHISVFHVGDAVIRCFVSDPPNNIYPPPDIIARYNSIIPYLQRMKNDLTFLVPHEWGKPGVKVKGTMYPYIKSPYLIGSQTLGDCLLDNHKQSDIVKVISQQWLKIIGEMEKQQIAHGDLDLSNVLVTGVYPNLSLHLVDLDGMYVPDFAGKGLELVDRGHENFQPAQKGVRKFNPEMDRFSALIIYLSLCALEINPLLWNECNATDRVLLLNEEDFQRLGHSVRFARLSQEQRNLPLQHCLTELQASIDRGQMPRALNDILKQPAYVQREQKYTPIVSSPYTGRERVIPLESDSSTHSSAHPEPVASIPNTSRLQRSSSPLQPTIRPEIVKKKAKKSRKGIVIFAILVIIAVILWILFLYINNHAALSDSSSFVADMNHKSVALLQVSLVLLL